MPGEAACPTESDFNRSQLPTLTQSQFLPPRPLPPAPPSVTYDTLPTLAQNSCLARRPGHSYIAVATMKKAR